jgi:hypothetical protein
MLAFRPESISRYIDPEGRQDLPLNTFNASIEHVTYLGETTLYRLSYRNGSRRAFEIMELNRGAEILHEETEITWRVAPANVIFCPGALTWTRPEAPGDGNGGFPMMKNNICPSRLPAHRPAPLLFVVLICCCLAVTCGKPAEPGTRPETMRKLTIVSPHNEFIRKEVGDRFLRASRGANPGIHCTIEWQDRGGTNDTVKYITSTFDALDNRKDEGSALISCMAEVFPRLNG